MNEFKNYDNRIGFLEILQKSDKYEVLLLISSGFKKLFSNNFFSTIKLSQFETFLEMLKLINFRLNFDHIFFNYDNNEIQFIKNFGKKEDAIEFYNETKSLIEKLETIYVDTDNIDPGSLYYDFWNI
ncbi:MAG: hypothetical protein ACTSWR_10545 [Candidatus Helarchaeota archaeon]